MTMKKTMDETIRRIINGEDLPLDCQEALEFVETTTNTDLRWSVAWGLYFYCSHYHGGQFSKEYEVLSRLGNLITVGPLVMDLNPDEDYDAVRIYEALGGVIGEED